MLTLFSFEIWMKHIDYQDQPLSFSTVSHGVLERVCARPYRNYISARKTVRHLYFETIKT